MTELTRAYVLTARRAGEVQKGGCADAGEPIEGAAPGPKIHVDPAR